MNIPLVPLGICVKQVCRSGLASPQASAAVSADDAQQHMRQKMYNHAVHWQSADASYGLCSAKFALFKQLLQGIVSWCAG